MMLTVTILIAVTLHSIFHEMSEERTRLQAARNHNDLVQLAALSMDQEIKSAYEQGYQTALQDSKRMDN